jgi:hypothetical protein
LEEETIPITSHNPQGTGSATEAEQGLHGEGAPQLPQGCCCSWSGWPVQVSSLITDDPPMPSTHFQPYPISWIHLPTHICTLHFYFPSSCLCSYCCHILQPTPHCLRPTSNSPVPACRCLPVQHLRRSVPIFREKTHELISK